MARPASGLSASPPADRSARRTVLADQIATVVLADGLGVLGLRGLAARLDTSGRMLLYYFGTKEALVLAVLDRINARMTAIMAHHATGSPTTPGALLGRVLARVAHPEIAPFMRVWTEVVARGARGEAPYDRMAATTVEAWISWIQDRLLPGEHTRGQSEAILSIVDGLTLLELARPGSTTQGRALLPGLLDGTG